MIATKTILQILTLAATYFTHAHAYMIDSSCNKGSVRQMAIDAVDDAMTQAQGALYALNERPWVVTTGGPSQRYYQDFSNLASWIFQDDGTRPPVAKLQQSPTASTPDPRGNLDRIRDRLNGVLCMKFLVDTGDGKQARIFCDLSRIQTGTNGKQWNSVSQVFTDADGPLCSGKNKNAAAVTYIPPALTPNAIQICPDYLNKQIGYRYHNLEYLRRKLPPKSRLVSLFSNDKDIDRYSVFSNTILHELFHTSAAERLDDIGGLKKAYGWSNIVNMRGDVAWKNADSAAYFALGVQMIRQNKIPQQDGSVQERS